MGSADGELAPPAWFTDIDDSFSYATVHDPWTTHYSRAIENQLDVVHVPFIHANTIGRGVGPVVDGPMVDWLDENRLRNTMHNRIDDGTPPVKPREMTRPDTEFWLEFIFPNLWQNHLGEKARIGVAGQALFVSHDGGRGDRVCGGGLIMGFASGHPARQEDQLYIRADHL